MKLKITVLFIAFISTFSTAQSKVGTVDSDYIVNFMPETKIVIKMTQDYGAKLDSSFNLKLEDFKIKVEDYKKKEKEMGVLEKKTIQQELGALEQDINKYQKNGNTLMSLKRDELMRPLYKRLGDAIAEVSKENSYTQILTTTGNQFAYLDDKFDITDLVIKKLGIKIPEVKQ
ncbi:OmpH family outer membrane protein [Polaribacter sp. IC073]|uniref:OmpH family outer membrane protein n=1 Tax=Polaribacter sp. IC073 TaxID=2508540 RepID=UPI0011BF71D0|nr:OmpH family outer membrane protein [Polaribacter sp. IC073]TXD49396.1 OmpH family outer membrane protein [Polaribacter sp. IC073]